MPDPQFLAEAERVLKELERELEQRLGEAKDWKILWYYADAE